VKEWPAGGNSSKVRHLAGALPGFGRASVEECNASVVEEVRVLANSMTGVRTRRKNAAQQMRDAETALARAIEEKPTLERQHTEAKALHLRTFLRGQLLGKMFPELLKGCAEAVRILRAQFQQMSSPT